jgi:predicted RNase H-like nuclease (RuvC/YqgF family)
MEYIEYFKGFIDVVKGLPNLEIIKDFVFWIIISILIISCLLQKYSKKHKVFTKIVSVIAEEFNNKIKEEMKEGSKDFHKAINKIDDKIEKINKENESVRADVDMLRKAIDAHLLESRTANAKQWREWIFDFQAKEKNGVVQPLERWENILKTITDYQQYISDYNIDNGYIDSAVVYIKTRYAKHCELNDFPLEDK